ncbi:hypothetical protein Q8A67_025798 [Cirrhinus molitorella]|uniref:Uncharacterized protein n=1 Tax=Cirrhinus molitorella TaxID=172907 RepID=A0AA88P0A3_9TELE|nr:hypothetical protein Q8A67_025798 [Cirrhinus molitorella]
MSKHTHTQREKERAGVFYRRCYYNIDRVKRSSRGTLGRTKALLSIDWIKVITDRRFPAFNLCPHADPTHHCPASSARGQRLQQILKNNRSRPGAICPGQRGVEHKRQKALILHLFGGDPRRVDHIHCSSDLRHLHIQTYPVISFLCAERFGKMRVVAAVGVVICSSPSLLVFPGRAFCHRVDESRESYYRGRFVLRLIT